MKIVAWSLVVLAGGWAIASPENCYFLESSGCGSGSGFCVENQIVCDVGYQSGDTGCGKKSPLSVPGSQRHCYKLIGVTTVACDELSPSGCEST